MKTDWLPSKRAGRLVMCRNWLAVMTAEVRAAWGIPQARYTELETLHGNAEALLVKAESAGRTPVIAEQCREAFAALENAMRFFKSHYFLVPPLTNADLVNLGLSPRDPHPTPSGEPKAEVTIETWQKAVGFLPRSLRQAANSMQLLAGVLPQAKLPCYPAMPDSKARTGRQDDLPDRKPRRPGQQGLPYLVQGCAARRGACCFSHHFLTAETTWSLRAERRRYLLRRCL